jgi:hypothetical protein
MRAKLFSLACCCLLTGVALAVHSQQQPEQTDDEVTVRGAFLTTRPGAEKPKPTPQVAASPKRPNTNATTASNTGPRHSSNTHGPTTAANRNKNTNGAGANGTQVASNNTDATITNATFSPAAIGIGYTLYMKDANGDAVRVDPGRVFHSGDAIRLSLEANTDGFLYVFYTENEGEPQMIFPDSRLGRGNNLIRAHVPYEVPSNMEADERLRWFVFDATPATEHVYIVVAREPLPNVPTGEILVGYCRDAKNSCPWNPPHSLWGQLIQAQGREQVAMSKIKDEGRTQTPREREATTRGLGLAPDAPEPTVVRMNASSTTGLLVTSIALTHK